MNYKLFFKKLIVVILIISTISTFITSSVSATGSDEPQAVAEENPPSDGPNIFADAVNSLLGSIVGFTTYGARIIAIYIARGINALTASLAYVEGTTIPNDKTVSTRVITPFDIFFNKVALLDINFFNLDNISTESLMYKFRSGIAVWYYVLRGMAISMLLVVLIYIGIRMAISTIASEKARYKKMLIDWVTSMAILFLTGMIISFTLLVNDSIINAIGLMCNSLVISDTFRLIQDIAFKVLDPLAIPATVIYCMLVWQTIALVISYFMRMLKLAFLVLISPLITITYSMDKIGDGKAQALGIWLKEFVFTVLIQPFHCIIYMIFVNIAFKLLLDNQIKGDFTQTLAAAVISILSVLFVKDAEKLVKKIFSFQDDGSGTSLLAGAAVASLALNKAKGVGSGAKSAINKTASGVKMFKDNSKSLVNATKKIGQGTKDAIGNSLVYAMAYKKRKENPNLNKEDSVLVARAERTENKTKKAEVKELAKNLKKQNKNMTKKEVKKEAEKEINSKFEQYKQDETQRIKAENPDLNMDDLGIEALSGIIASRKIHDESSEKKLTTKVAKKQRRSEKINKPIAGIAKAFKGPANTIGKMREIYKQSSLLQDVSKTAKGVISTGIGISVGSGIMGLADSNEMIAGLAGFQTASKSSKAFMETNAKNSVNEMNNNLRAMGVTSAEEAAVVVDEIMAKYDDDDEEAKKELEALGKQLVEQLKTLVTADKANEIKNTIEHGISIDPTKTQQVIKEAFKRGRIDPSKNGVVADAAQKFAAGVNEREFFKKAQEQIANGYSLDLTAARVVKGFDHNAKYYDSDSEKPENESMVRAYMSDGYLNDDKELQAFMDQLEIESDKFIENVLANAPTFDPSDELTAAATDQIRQELELARIEALNQIMTEFDKKQIKISNDSYERFVKTLENSQQFAQQHSDEETFQKLDTYKINMKKIMTKQNEEE